MYVYRVESFAHIECYSDCSRRGSHLVEPLCYGAFSVCSAVTVECFFVPVLHGCVCCYVGKKALFQCLQLLKGGIWACMRCPCLCRVLG